MNDESGEFSFKAGFPAKSGVSGALMIVIPGKCGFCVWSPRVNGQGNSVRGTKFCLELSNRFNFHHFDDLVLGHAEKVDPCNTFDKQEQTNYNQWSNLWWSAARGDLVQLRRLLAHG